MKISTLIRFLVIPAALPSILLLQGCAMFDLASPRKTERSSSVVDFLYPKQTEPVVSPEVPVLHLPLRVGLAFVPPAADRRTARDDFSEAQKTDLLRRVADEFRSSPFIGSIQLIPSTYLRPSGSFDNLGQIKALLGVDVVVLLAYDQLQFTDANKLSLAYWTIVGAYVFKGNRNDTHTLLEAVVYDIPSRKLLFHAPGADQTQAKSTAVDVRDRLRRDSAESFDRAADDLIANLKTELVAFKTRIKDAPEEVQIAHRPGYTGAGALESWFAVAAALLGVAGWRARTRP